MTIFLTILILTTVVALYAVLVRPWLRDKTWAQGYFRLIEPIELRLFKKSESLIWARWNQFLGYLLTLAGFLGGIDYTMIMPFVPEKYHGLLPMLPMAISALGWLAEALRRDTTKPLEVVAVPDDAPVEVKEAIAEADAAKAAAVAVVAEKKQEGEL